MSPYLEHAAQLEEELHEVKEENRDLSEKIETMSKHMKKHLDTINDLQWVERQRDEMKRQLTKALEEVARLNEKLLERKNYES